MCARLVCHNACFSHRLQACQISLQVVAAGSLTFSNYSGTTVVGSFAVRHCACDFIEAGVFTSTPSGVAPCTYTRGRRNEPVSHGSFDRMTMARRIVSIVSWKDKQVQTALSLLSMSAVAHWSFVGTAVYTQLEFRRALTEVSATQPKMQCKRSK